jgi:omega-amidase
MMRSHIPRYCRMRLASRPLALLVSTACSSAWAAGSGSRISKTAFVNNSSRTSRTSPLMSMRMASTDADTTSKSLRVALCQFHVTHNKEKNYETVKDYLRRAAQAGAELTVLPEVWNSPYATAAFPEFAEKLPNIGDSDTNADESPSSQILMDLAKEHKMWIVGGSIPEVVKEDDESKIYNTCLVVNPEGEIVAKHRKVHLFDIDIPGGITFKESETLSPGTDFSVFSTPVGNIGVGICYDIRFAEYAMLLRQKYQCLVLVYPGAFNLTTGPAHWELLQRGRALDNQCYVLTASPARTTEPAKNSKYPHYTAWGHSTVVSPWGDVVATTDEKEGIVVADLDLSKVEEIRRNVPIGEQRRPDMYKLEQTS